MLGKLFKYDMKALSRVLLPLHGAVLLLGVLACVCGFVGYSTEGSLYNDSPAATALAVSMAAIVGFALLGMFSALVATLVVIIHRFYKNLYTDEGYLTFTLPVTANQILLSKVLAGLLWLLIDMVVIGIGAMLVSLGASGFADARFESSLPYWMLYSLSGNVGGDATLNVIIGMVASVIQCTLSLMLAYTAFALGATIAARHKVAAGIGLYIGATWVVGIINTIVMILIATMVPFDTGTSASTAFSIASSVASWIVWLALAAGCYAWCIYLLNRKVNLA